MTYEQALAFIHDSYRFGIKLGLENMEKLLRALGNPQEQLQFIHIAGTNGKGSTASFIANALKVQGYQVGKYISPYLEVFNERIQINDSYISNEALATCTEIVKHAVDKVKEEDFIPTEFEIVTAIGFVYFMRQNVDYVILEVGLGGRFDATNVISSPLASVITPISMDHTQYLGETIEAIAFEKAGIIKEGGLVISAQKSNVAQAVITDTCKLRNARLTISKSKNATSIKTSIKGTTFNYRGIDFNIHLLGLHQVHNACHAIDVLLTLRECGKLDITDGAIVKGLKQTTWIGRFEKILDSPVTIIDGAHNIDGINAFISAIKTYQPQGERIAIFGMMADKDVKTIVKQIDTFFDVFYLIKPPNIRAIEPLNIKNMLLDNGYKGDIHILHYLEEINTVINKYCNGNSWIYGFGSFYFIGEMRKLVKKG